MNICDVFNWNTDDTDLTDFHEFYKIIYKKTNPFILL
jgi:hypothetical protein